MKANSFPCTECGACCRNIAGIEQLIEFCDANGCCIYLTANHKCSIYQNRPTVCRTDEMYVQFYHDEMTLNEFYDMNAAACNSLQVIENINEIYRVKTGV